LLEIGAQEVITKDNAVIVANAIAFIKIVDPVKAVYGISNYEYAIQNLSTTRPSSRDGTGPCAVVPRRRQGPSQRHHFR
jgi:hypothetical protein